MDRLNEPHRPASEKVFVACNDFGRVRFGGEG